MIAFSFSSSHKKEKPLIKLQICIENILSILKDITGICLKFYLNEIYTAESTIIQILYKTRDLPLSPKKEVDSTSCGMFKDCHL